MRHSDADVIQFSGCRDDQTSADAHIDNQATGIMSHAFIKVLGIIVSHVEWLKGLVNDSRDNTRRYHRCPRDVLWI
jgi:hypothetical protein